MIDRELDIQTRDGLMNTFITYPEEGGPFPVVIFYMDAPGKREELHDDGASASAPPAITSCCRICTTAPNATSSDRRERRDAQTHVRTDGYAEQPARQRRHARHSRFSRRRRTREFRTDRLCRLLHERAVRCVRRCRICAAHGRRGVVLWRAPVYRRAGFPASDGEQNHGRTVCRVPRRPTCRRRRR